MTESKSRLLYILKYLWQNTDEEHFASTADIVSGLAEKDIDIDRHTLPADIEALQRAGFDIECQKSSRNLYYLSSRTFELPELKLLVDAVESSRFIPAKRSRELVEKLCSLTSVHLAKELNRHLFVEGRIKSDNRALYYTIDTIHKAINCKRQIRFRYYEYTVQKKKVFKHNGCYYEFSPYALLWCSENYYVLGHSERHGKITKFRVDRMECPTVLEKSATRKPDGFDPIAYLIGIFSMYDGETKEVRLKCDNSLMKTVIDRFGRSVCTAPCGDGTFIATVEISVSRTFFGWVFGFGGKMKIAAPDDVREDYMKMLRAAMQ